MNNPALLIGALTFFGVCYLVRKWRERNLQELRDDQQHRNVMDFVANRNLNDLIVKLERTGLMGMKGAKSVRVELDNIRKWHQKRGFHGGLIVHDVTKPLFGSSTNKTGTMNHKRLNTKELDKKAKESTDSAIDGTNDNNDNNNNNNKSNNTNLEEIVQDPMQMARRECYYLYYEITGSGEVRQEIFCRGTTLAIDILTCLQFWMTYDAELQCRVHLGFRNHADRILDDVIPLLASPDDKRATIEISGHSLGGAVAYILAVKLKKRGYNVRQVTAVGAPRFCATPYSAAKILQDLPEDNLRVENALDFVPYLPPFGSHVGNKLWVVDNSDIFFVPAVMNNSWVDSVFVNFQIPEMLATKGQTHRVPYHVKLLKALEYENNDDVFPQRRSKLDRKDKEKVKVLS